MFLSLKEKLQETAKEKQSILAWLVGKEQGCPWKEENIGGTAGSPGTSCFATELLNSLFWKQAAKLSITPSTGNGSF